MTLHDRVSAALADAGMKTANSQTAQLRRNAVDAGWPQAAAKSIKVRHNDGAFHAEFSDDAGEWEFGTEDRPPIAIVRTWQVNLDENVNSPLQSHLWSNLRGLV